MSNTLYHGRRFGTFNLMDDFSRHMLDIEVDTSLPAERVIGVLDQVATWRGLPAGFESTTGLTSWPKRWRIGQRPPASSSCSFSLANRRKHAFIERLNGTYRYEMLDGYVFETLDNVRELTHRWMEEYNTEPPHHLQ